MSNAHKGDALVSIVAIIAILILGLVAMIYLKLDGWIFGISVGAISGLGGYTFRALVDGKSKVLEIKDIGPKK